MQAGNIYALVTLDTSYASSLAVDGQGNIFAFMGQKVLEIPANDVNQWGMTMKAGCIYYIAGYTTATKLTGPSAPALDGDGNLYFVQNGELVRMLAAKDGTKWGIEMKTGYLYTIVDGLQSASGIAVDSAGNLHLSDYRSVTDEDGEVIYLESQLEEITVKATAPAIATATLPGGTVGTAYSQTLAAAGDTPITWSVDSGSLPDGLTLASGTVIISGTPSASGIFPFTVKAVNSKGDNTKTLSIVISAVNHLPGPKGTVPTQSMTEGGSASFIASDIAEDADSDTLTVTGIVTGPNLNPSIATASLNNDTGTVTVSGVTAPVRDGTPVTSITETAQYTGTVGWSPDDGTFAASTEYTATITLTPKTGYALTGVTKDFFTVSGATSVSNDINAGVITAVFPKTEAEPAVPDTVISIAAIGGVTAPVRGGILVTSITETAQYTGTVTWSPINNPFAASTSYTATIILTPKTGFTLTGVAADFFTVAGATSVSNNAASGVITALFPTTEAEQDVEISISQSPIRIVLNALTFGLFFNDTIDVSISSADTVDHYEYQIVADGDTFNENGTWTTGHSFSVNKDFKGKIYTRAVYSGGIVSDTAVKALVVDKTKPAISANYDAVSGSITVSVTDSGAGIEAITYQVGSGTKQAINLEPSASKDITTQHSFTISSLPDGNYNVVIEVTDNSGNKAVTKAIAVSVSIVPVTSITATGEDTSKIVVYYISGSGELIMVPDCVYDASTGKVTFKTNHFSSYAVGYNDVSFTDVSGWYADYVSYLAARKITNGTGDGKFSPDANITRAEFVTSLARLSGDDLSGYASSSFSNVATTDWYFAAVQCAYKNGIASGSDGKFDPGANITREQMAAMLYRYAKYAGADVSNAEGMFVREFSDYDSISNWALEPIQWAMNNSIISGNSDGSFAAIANATRAQAAKMIALLMQGMMK